MNLSRAILLLAPALPGCASGGRSDRPTGGDSSAADLDVEVWLDEDVLTVVHVGWATDAPGTGRVEYGPTVAYGQELASEAEPADTHFVSVLGLSPATDYHLRVVAEVGGEEATSEDYVVTTGSLAQLLPLLDVEVDAGDAANNGYTVVSVITPELGQGGTSSVAVLDGLGAFVWSYEVGGTPTSAAFTQDRVGVLVLVDDEIVRKPLGEGPAETYALSGAHHDFAELPDGTLAFLRWDQGEVLGSPVLASALWERRTDGESVEVWRFLDHYSDFGLAPESLAGYPEGVDVDHANSVAYAPEDEAYYVGFTGAFRGVARIDRATGGTTWSACPDSACSVRIEVPHPFVVTHEAWPVPGGILQYVNQVDGDTCSRVVEIAIEEPLGLASQIWEYVPEACYETFALGGVRRTANGHTAISWSSAGVLEQVDETGDTVLRVSAELGFAFGYGDYADSLYPRLRATSE